jgi:hypothetical protein
MHATDINIFHIYLPLHGGLSDLILPLRQQPMKTELDEEQLIKDRETRLKRLIVV